jgi:hypothetical protein
VNVVENEYDDDNVRVEDSDGVHVSDTDEDNVALVDFDGERDTVYETETVADDLVGEVEMTAL